MSNISSIAEWGLRCSKLLTTAWQNKTSNTSVQAEFETLRTRFNIWAGSVGAFAPGNASVDYRLRDDKDIADVVCHLLSRLHENLAAAINPPLLEEAEEDSEQGDESSDESDSGSGFSLSLDEDSDGHLETQADGGEKSVGSFAPANAIIDRLYRLSSVLRKSVSTSENARVRNFIAKTRQNTEGDLEPDYFESFKSSIQWLVKVRFPNSPEYLVERFSTTILFRRAKLLYRKRHHEKLAQVATALAIERSSFGVSAEESDAFLEGTIYVASDLQREIEPQNDSQIPAASPRSVLSDTIASSVDRQRFAKYATSVSMASVTPSAMARGHHLDVPSPPAIADPGLQETICPYCFRPITKEITEEPKWTQHILKDIEPYICLFEKCESPETMFSNPTEWLNHMQWQHTIVWSCLFGGHENIVKDSREELEDHLRSTHGDSLSKDQLRTLVQTGARPHPDTFGVLAFDSLRAPQNDATNRCLVCGEDFADQNSTRTGGIQDHYLEHLEALALLALPEREDADDLKGSDWREDLINSVADSKGATDTLERYLSSLEHATSDRDEKGIENEQHPRGSSSNPAWAGETKPKDRAGDTKVGKGDRIIVSIDFGTTFSSLAWALTSRPGQINIVDEWPSATGVRSSPKVPTELRRVSNGYQWGFQIPPTAKRSKYFKMKLDDPIASSTDGTPPEELTHIYLSYLYNYLENALERGLSLSLVRSTPIDFMLTVPAIWSNASKQKLVNIALKVGFKGSKEIYLVSEPEAAAVYTFNKLGNSGLQVGRTFVLCDAGGLTVDLISYKILQLVPSLVIREAAAGTGAKCGSALLNQKFRRYLQQHCGGEYWTDERLVPAVNSFEQFKKSFVPDGEPLSLPVDMSDDASFGVQRGRLRISQTDMASAIFEPVISDILALVNEQITMAGKNTVAAVLLVGGFGNSAYLGMRVRAVVGQIQVLQPANVWTAVVEGAAMMGLARANIDLAKVNIASRTARKHYGTELTAPYDPTRDDESQKFWFEKWQNYAVTRMFWFVTKGESYPENRPSIIEWSFDIPVNRGAKTGSSVTIYVNERDEEAPRHRNANTKRLGKLEIDLDRVNFRKKLFATKKLMGGHWYNCFKCTIEARYESAWITYSLKMNGETHDLIKADYS